MCIFTKNQKGENTMRNSIKKIAALLLALIAMIPAGAVAVLADTATTVAQTPKYTATEGWGDTDGDGVFEIATPGDLYAMAEKRLDNNSYSGKTVILTADIDLNPGWDANSKTAATNMWTSMFYMRGVFDGQGHTIRGLCAITEGDNATFVTLGTLNTTFKNLRIENSYFCAKGVAVDKNGKVSSGNGAGLLSATTSQVKFENVYIDAICEAKGHAGAFLSWFNCTEAYTPNAQFKNCVFVGSVRGGTSAGGIVGTNDKHAGNPTSKGTNTIVLTDCANYGKISCADLTKAAGLVGDCANKASFTRCYSAGSAATAFMNINTSTLKNLNNETITVGMSECYYLGGTGVTAMNKSAAETVLTMKYDGANSTEAKTATMAELLEKTSFKASDTNTNSWKMDKTNKYAIPTVTALMLEAHEHVYTSSVTEPTCAAKGFTTYKCECGHTYTDNEVDALPHTEGTEWIVDKEATEEFAGLRHKECTVCHNSVKSEVIPKLTSTDTESADTAPATEAPATEAPAKEGGCGGSIAMSGAFVMSSVLALSGIVVSKKRK